MSERQTSDISPEAREVAEWKAAKRLELRNEYLREVQDPRRTSIVQDTGLQRFYATRVQAENLYKPNVKNVIPGIMVALLIWGTAEVLNKRKEHREHLYRTGQVRYVDRIYKFK